MIAPIENGNEVRDSKVARQLRNDHAKAKGREREDARVTSSGIARIAVRSTVLQFFCVLVFLCALERGRGHRSSWFDLPGVSQPPRFDHCPRVCVCLKKEFLLSF